MAVLVLKVADVAYNADYLKVGDDVDDSILVLV